MISRYDFIRTRFAPTPSGYLHLGNLASFMLTAALADASGAKVLLRIDDLDQTRVRKQYLEDVFETLSFFELGWDEGPGDLEEHLQLYSQVNRIHLYQDMLGYLRDAGLLYACNCSRSELAHFPASEGYSGRCREKNLPLDAEGVCWRMVTDHDILLELRGLAEEVRHATLPAGMRDFVVRKKDGHASYQLASVADDIFFGVDLIVRGEDLRDSSWAQLYLARHLPSNGFPKARFVHHPLLMTGRAQKLSKSAGDTSVRALRETASGPADLIPGLSAALGVGEGLRDRYALGKWMIDHWIA
jgi:glutamyl-tRNA synthetase